MNFNAKKRLTFSNASAILTVRKGVVTVAQLGRALDCGSSGCGFKPHRSPFSTSSSPLGIRRHDHDAFDCYRPEEFFEYGPDAFSYSQLHIFLCAWEQGEGLECAFCLYLDETFSYTVLGVGEVYVYIVYFCLAEQIEQHEADGLFGHSLCDVFFFLFRHYLKVLAATKGVNVKKTHTSVSLLQNNGMGSAPQHVFA